MAKIIAITSGKGGVGKTTLSASCAVALAAKGEKTLLVDGDIGLRDLDLVLGVENEVLFDVRDLWKGKCSKDDALISLRENLDLLPANQTNRWEDGGKKKFKKLMGELEGFYDYILIDCPAGIGAGVEVLLELADQIVVVVEPVWTSIRDGERLMRSCRRKRWFDYTVVLNAVRLEAQEVLVSLQETLAALQGENLGAVLPFSNRLRQFANAGELLLVEEIEDFYQSLQPLLSFFHTGETVEEVIICKKFFEILAQANKQSDSSKQLKTKLERQLRQRSWRMSGRHR